MESMRAVTMVYEVYDVSIMYDEYACCMMCPSCMRFMGGAEVSMVDEVYVYEVYGLCMRWPWCMRCTTMYDGYHMYIVYKVCEWCMKCL